ncbi:MAG TPA: hypothetical protein VG106_16060, partial [Vicinamibacterales bacterium]|nr:hypothetical protein [Vicinamibacterales bacterium]
MKRPLLTWFACGVAAASVAIGVAEIAAGLVDGRSIIAGVGSLVIALQPPGGKDLMVALFGENDKLALEVMTAVGGVLLGGVLGLVGARNVRLAIGGFAAAGLAAFLVLQRDPLASVIQSAITSTAAVGAG